MTIYHSGFGGGETLDALIDGSKGAEGNAALPSEGSLAVISTPVQSGVGALQVPASTAAYGVIHCEVRETCIWGLQAYLNFNGNPNSIVPVFAPYATTFTGAYIVEANATTRELRICLLGTDGDYATRTPITPWSVAAIGNGSYTSVIFIVDPLTLGTDHVIGHLFVGGIQEFCVDMGVYPAAMSGVARDYVVGTYGVSPNVALRIDDTCGLWTTSATDAPHLAAWPIAMVDAQHAVADSTHNMFTMFPNGGESRWQDWDDATGNDGDSTYLVGGTYGSADAQNSTMESLATLGWNASATVIEWKTATGGYSVCGPVLGFVCKSGAGTKFSATTFCNLATAVSLDDPGSSYKGELRRLPRTSGVWARADAGTILPGLVMSATGNDILLRVTTMMLQWLICNNEYLPLAATPMIPQGAMF